MPGILRPTEEGKSGYDQNQKKERVSGVGKKDLKGAKGGQGGLSRSRVSDDVYLLKGRE